MKQTPTGNPVEEARLLLPWYITGKLDAGERSLVEQMLAHDAGLRAEYQRELKLVEMIRHNHALLDITAVDSTQQRLGKLLQRIEREAQMNTSNVPASPPPATRTHSPWWANWRDYLPQAHWFTPVSAVLAALLLAQTAVLTWFINQEQPLAIYQTVTASEPQDAASPTPSGTVLMIVFKETAQIQQLNNFLQRWNARILDGPAPGNVYKIEVRDISPDAQNSTLLPQQMQQEQSLVVFVGNSHR